MADAERHERAADTHARIASSAEGSFGTEKFECDDTVLNDQLTSGGLRVTTWQPCFDLEDETEGRHRKAAERQRELARRDRARAAALLDLERNACAGVPERELQHSPFSHRRSIAQIEPLREGDRPVGVRVLFKPVRGLDAAWMRRDIACHRARWAVLGRDPGHMPDDPTLVEGAQIDVHDRAGQVEVIVRTRTPEQAVVAIARARGELVEETATAP